MWKLKLLRLRERKLQRGYQVAEAYPIIISKVPAEKLREQQTLDPARARLNTKPPEL